jgi:hypothetical protein
VCGDLPLIPFVSSMCTDSHVESAAAVLQPSTCDGDSRTHSRGRLLGAAECNFFGCFDDSPAILATKRLLVLLLSVHLLFLLAVGEDSSAHVALDLHVFGALPRNAVDLWEPLAAFGRHRLMMDFKKSEV